MTGEVSAKDAKGAKKGGRKASEMGEQERSNRRETERLGPAYEAQPRLVALCVGAVAGREARGRGQQPLPLVVADSVNTDASTLGELTNLHGEIQGLKQRLGESVTWTMA